MNVVVQFWFSPVFAGIGAYNIFVIGVHPILFIFAYSVTFCLRARILDTVARAVQRSRCRAILEFDASVPDA